MYSKRDNFEMYIIYQSYIMYFRGEGGFIKRENKIIYNLYNFDHIIHILLYQL